jgi:hypothetical protein
LNCSGYSGIVVVPYSFQNLFFLLLWKLPLDFDKDCIESVCLFVQHGHFNDVNSSNLWAWNIFLSIWVFFYFFHFFF